MLSATPWWLRSYCNVYPYYKDAIIRALVANNIAAYDYLFSFIEKECHLGNS